MDNLYSLISIFLPLIFGIYLLISRIMLSLVNKKVLNFGLIIVNLLSLAGFIYTKNPYLIYSSLAYFLIAIFSYFYFKKKKQFLFTKQRYFIFLSLLIFNTYAFFACSNLLYRAIFWILESVIIFIFSYFDIFKNPANYNILRFFRINIIGDFCLVLALLILLKYARFYSIDYCDINSLVLNIQGHIEYKVLALALFIAIISRLIIFPFNCYYSFFSNSSSLLYLCALPCANCAFGAYLLKSVNPCLDSFIKLIPYIIVSAVISFVLIFFEKNIKIITGYIVSIINCGFFISYIYYRKDIIIFLYLAVILVILCYLAYLFYKDKINIEKRIINKQKGFLLERIHIYLFEKLPYKIYEIVNFTDEKIMQNVIQFAIYITGQVVSLFVIKTTKLKRTKMLTNILILFALISIFAIFIALFGRFE